MLGLARHAEAVKNVRGDIIGGNGTGLTEAGSQQAKKLARTLVSIARWDTIYHSEQPQCLQSLEHLLAEVAAPCVALEIPKYGLGDIEGIPAETLVASMPDVAGRFALWKAGLIDIASLALPGADDPELYYARGVRFLDQLPVEKNVLIISTRSVLVLLCNALAANSPASRRYREVPWYPAQVRVYDDHKELIHDVRNDT